MELGQSQLVPTFVGFSPPYEAPSSFRGLFLQDSDAAVRKRKMVIRQSSLPSRAAFEAIQSTFDGSGKLGIILLSACGCHKIMNEKSFFSCSYNFRSISISRNDREEKVYSSILIIRTRDVGSIQKWEGGTCCQRHTHKQKRALCKLKRGTLCTNLLKIGGHVPLCPCAPSSYVHDENFTVL